MRKKPGSLRAAYERINKQEGDRIRTMEMLLGATWRNGYFLQRKLVGGVPIHCYYDKDGNVIPHPPHLKIKETEE